MLDFLPSGWWHVAETQASRYQQCALQSYLCSLSRRSGRHIRSSLGAPAALRPGSVSAGSWTGVLSFGDCPLRQVPCVWPDGEFESGRVLLTSAYINSLEVFGATVYLPPRGPTYPRAVELAESLLQPITEELVLGRAGPRAILGDMNCSVGALKQMEIWEAHGWIELQTLMNHLHGLQPQNTCKKATRPDQIWLSPELASLVVNVAIWDIFPDHSALLAGIKIPAPRVSEFQWRLPGHIPWDGVCKEQWTSMPSLGCLFRSNPPPVGCVGLADVPEGNDVPHVQTSSTLDFRRWSKSFEVAVSKCVGENAGKADRSFHGRGQLTRPTKRRVFAPIPKPHRPGEVAQASGMLNRAVAAWYKQLRRLQSYCHAVKSPRAHDNYLSRASLWNSIRNAHGFQGGFHKWWFSRPFQHQGVPNMLPLLPPDEALAQLVFEDFVHNYRRFEHWQLQRRKESCRAKLLATTKALYTVTRKPAKPALDCLEDDFSQVIHVTDTVNNLVSVPLDFPTSSVTHWTLQGLPARVTKVGSQYQVSSDLVLASGQTLSCHQAVTCPEVIHNRLVQLWSPRWNKHSQVPDSAWDQVCQHIAETLPQGSIALPPITVSVFRQAVHRFKPQAATGPCGWTRTDLINLTDDQVQAVVDGYHAIEQGKQPWPQQWSVGLIHCLQKKDHCSSVDHYRPITVTSLFYRLFAGIRAGQILAQLAAKADDFQCGFLQGHQASDVWFFIGICLEISACQSSPIHGITADLVKAYNTLPRRPAFFCLEVLGVPRWFLAAWKSHLSQFERFFVVRRCVGSAVRSVTGFPEGCPLACAAMAALDCLWHWSVRLRVPRVLPFSYVDNLELVCDQLASLFAAHEVQEGFCHMLDLELDVPRLFAWSSTPAGRRELKDRGFRVSLGERDLGGQVIYCRMLRNKVLTDRIVAALPYFGKLRSASCPTAVKVMNIKQTLFPRALHGCEAVIVGSAHLDRLRSAVMKALHWNRKGSSPVVRLGMLHVELDPHWYQLWRTVTLFRHQCRKSPTIRDWWRLFSQHCHAERTFGPFGKLQEELHSIGLVIDAEGKLWFSENGFIDIFVCSDALLITVLRYHFHNRLARQMQSRKGFEDLEGFDYSLTVSSDSKFSVAQQEQLMIVRDGTFFTNHVLSKFDARKEAICGLCGAVDDKEHRYTTCCRYDGVRAQHQELFQLWEDLPICFCHGGLVPSNPWQLLYWEALVSLPDKTREFVFQPHGKVWQVFTDGSCLNPECPEESLAAWSVVVAGRGTVSTGVLRGIQQSILRAEITAAYSAICWATMRMWSCT